MEEKNSFKTSPFRFFLISENLLSAINKTSIEESYRSDHSMILLDISFVQFQKGKPLWKHNNSLLQEINYLQVIKIKIIDVKKQYAIPIYNIENIHKIPDNEIQFTINDQLFNETILIEIRGKSISYSSHRKKESEKREKELIENIKEVETNLSDTNINEIEVLKEELKIFRQNKMQGILIRSRAQIIEEDEKATNFFCNLEKHKFQVNLHQNWKSKMAKSSRTNFKSLTKQNYFMKSFIGVKMKT